MCEHFHIAIVTRHIERSCCQCKAALDPTVYQCNAPASLPILCDCVRDSERVHDPSRFRKVSIHSCEKKVTLQLDVFLISFFFFRLPTRDTAAFLSVFHIKYAMQSPTSKLSPPPKCNLL